MGSARPRTGRRHPPSSAAATVPPAAPGSRSGNSADLPPATEPAVAALLNGVRLPALEFGTRPSRGKLPLTALTDPTMADRGVPDTLDYDGFHLLLGTPSAVTVWSWDGRVRTRLDLPPGDHIVVNLGVNNVDDPLVPHFAPLLAALPDPPLVGETTEEAWGPWLDPASRRRPAAGRSPRVAGPQGNRRFRAGTEQFAGKVYGSGSATLVAIAPDHVRYDFTGTPATPQWTPVLAEGRDTFLTHCAIEGVPSLTRRAT